MVIEIFPLQCGSHVPRCPQWNKLPSHRPPGNPFNFNLDQVGKSCLPTVNCKLDQFNNIWTKIKTPLYEHLFNELKDTTNLMATVSGKGLNLSLFQCEARPHPASVPETVTLAHTMTVSHKWMNYWPCIGDIRQASPSVFPKAWCWIEARPFFQWWSVSKCSKEVVHLKMLPTACFQSMSRPDQNVQLSPCSWHTKTLRETNGASLVKCNYLWK